MPIAPNTQFDHYEILAPLGKGGMGEVYRAKDTRLNRDVAIKVLPGEVAHDAERLRRFEMEARAVGALNHPNILTVYDFGMHDGNPYLVMELLEGAELRAQLDNGALPVRKAIDYAQQIAAGLTAAHSKNIVHRDLKPANVFIMTDGRVKILDFGLAKLRQARRGEDDSTLSLPSERNDDAPNTDPGVVMGTVGYMSPEQVRGEVVDQRADIFSFGVMLYEMLSGQRPFTGASHVEVMHAILKDEPPDLSETNTKIAPQVDKIVRHCLEKKPEMRFQSARDLGFALEALTLPSSSGANRTEAVPVLTTTTLPKPSGWRERIAWMAAGVLALALLALGVAYVRRPALEAEPMRFSVTPPEKAKLFDWPTISPDGRTLAFVAEVDGKTQLWVRPLGVTTARPLVEVPSNLSYPFWSPDSQFIAYFEQGKLKKIALAGGTPESLCDVASVQGGTWNRDGVILFGSREIGIKRVSANGGAVTNVTHVDTAHGDLYHFAPTFLPDGRHFLYHSTNSDAAKSGIYLTRLEGGETRQMLSTTARNVGWALNPADAREGYLIFVRQGVLLAQPFDFSRHQLLGDPVRIAEYVPAPVLWARYSLATNGVLILLGREVEEQLTWFDRTGKKLGTVGPTGAYTTPRLSPDGQRLAVAYTNSPLRLNDIYLFDLASGAGTPFTFDPKLDHIPIWSPDGSQIVWSSNREGVQNLFQKAASGAGQDEVLLRSPYLKQPSDWSSDGRFILYYELHPQTGGDVWVLPMEGERKPWPWLNTSATEGFATISPDGKWIAYTSNESGRNEIYLQAFVPGAPASGSKRQLSTGGGANSRWRRDGRELYYLSGDGKLMVVAITPGAELKAGMPQELFVPNGHLLNANRGYTATGEGQRFLFVTSAEDASVPPFTVVLNWMAELKR